MKTIGLVFGRSESNILSYLIDKYQSDPVQIIMKALSVYYAEDIKDLERAEYETD